MPAPLERLHIGHVYAQSFRILMRDFLAIMAIAYLVSGAGTVAQGLLAGRMAGDKQPLDAVIPWLVGFIPFALADAAIVWVALRRLAASSPWRSGASACSPPSPWRSIWWRTRRT